MKKTLLLLLGVLALNSWGRDVPFPVEPRIPRRAVIATEKHLTMVSGGQIGFDLVVPKDASPSAKYAGKEMSELLSQAFLCKVDVKEAATAGKTAIVLGDQSLAKAWGIDIASFDRDGFVIQSKGNTILIIGRDHPKNKPTAGGEHATLFGAYEFLERFAGIRFFFPGKYGTVIPKRKNWRVPAALDIYERPDYIQRRYLARNCYDIYAAPYIVPDDIDWKVEHERSQLRNRKETIGIPNCHGLAMLGYLPRFGQSHPEYFALKEDGTRHNDPKAKPTSSSYGHICFSSGIKDEIVADALSFFKNEPATVRGVTFIDGKQRWGYPFVQGLPFFNIMLNDSAYHCHCPKCWEHFSKGPQESSNFIWSFFKELADRIKAEGGNGYLTTMAYATYKPIPDLEIPDNVLVMLATRGPWNEGTPGGDKELQLVKDWQAKMGGQKLWLWTYPGKHYNAFPGIPHGTPRAAASFIKRMAPHIFGVFWESESDSLMFSYLPFYVYGKGCWNTNLDIDALLDDHANAMFGPGAEPMKDFFESVEKHWMQIATNVVETPAGPVTVYPSELTLWSKIYSPEELKRLNGLFDKAEKLCVKDEECQGRVRYIRKNFLQLLLDTAKKYNDTNDAVNTWRFFMAEAPAAPAIDGNLNDKAWEAAKPMYLSPLGGTNPAEVKTTVRALRDKDNFYFAFDCEEPEEPLCRKRKHDDKDLWKDSDVEIFLSTDGNREKYHQVLVNVGGQTADIHNTRVSLYGWESKCEAKVQVQPGKGWTVEVRVPRSKMPPAMADGILANFSRHRVLKDKNKPVKTEYYCWSPFARTFGDVSRFGSLSFKPDNRVNLISNPDFIRTKHPVHPDGAWFSWQKDYTLDTSTFVTEGISAKLVGPNVNYVHRMEGLKPDTEYVLSYFLRTDMKAQKPKWCGFSVRVDDMTGNPVHSPKANHGESFDGVWPWHRQELRFKTAKNCGANGKPYMAFTLSQSTGNAWIDHVELYEIPAEKK